MAQAIRWAGDEDQVVWPTAGCLSTDSYISLLRKGRKFGIVQVTGARLDIGVKLKGVEPTDRFESAEGWNSMVTHHERVNDPAQLDDEVLDWLKRAYENASASELIDNVCLVDATPELNVNGRTDFYDVLILRSERRPYTSCARPLNSDLSWQVRQESELQPAVKQTAR